MLRTTALALAASTLTAAGPAKVDMPARILPPPAKPGAAVTPFVSIPSGTIALTHVRVIDGTGATAQADRTVLIAESKIVAIRAGGEPIPVGYRVIDLTGKSVLPGIVGMHDHQYYVARPNLAPDGKSERPVLIPQMPFSSPRLYLAGGVTTLRTTGSVEPYTDLNMKAAIDAGTLPGPHMDVTGPYLEGSNSPFLQMHPLKDAADSAQTVEFWADRGVTSFKAYMNITRAELKAAIDAAHARGIKVTGHLCSITYPEAAALGIDDLEHGFGVNTQADPGKTPDVCPASDGGPTLTAMTADSVAAKALILSLVTHHVAITSTLPVFEWASGTARTLPSRQLDLLSTEARADYLYTRARVLQIPAARRATLAKQWANGLALGARVRSSRRAADRGARPDWRGRCTAGLRRPARNRIAGRCRLLAGRGDPHR